MLTTHVKIENQFRQNFDLKTFAETVLYAGVTCGVLDATDGVIAFYLLYGLNPIQVLQFIASGAIGPAAFDGGLLTAGIGAFFHFVIAFVAAAVFAVAAQFNRTFRDHWLVTGALYGAVIWAFMNLIVVPHSAAQAPPLTLPAVLNGVLGHAVFVGVAISWFTRKSEGTTK